MKYQPQDVLNDLNQALKEFGEYTYRDKGAEEIMDVKVYYDFLKAKQASEVIAFLEELYQLDKNSEKLISAILMRLQDCDDFDRYMESDILAKLF